MLGEQQAGIESRREIPEPDAGILCAVGGAGGEAVRVLEIVQ